MAGNDTAMRCRSSTSLVVQALISRHTILLSLMESLLGLWSWRKSYTFRYQVDTNVRPIDGQPIYWDITAPARYDGTKSVTADVRTHTAIVSTSIYICP
jgi:hypothetical protein